MRVLVADDDSAYRSLLNELLSQWGFEVVLVSDGAAVLEVLNQPDSPRMILLDWMMPKMNGFEVTEAIRKQKNGDRKYILLITGSAEKQDIMRVLVCGADDYLLKPFDPMNLKIHLRSAMRVLNLQEELDQLRNSTDRQSAQLTN